jgi:hypothetical protein
MRCADFEIKPLPHRISIQTGDPADFAPHPSRRRIELEPGKVERGLLQLVLAVIELIRQLMEKQALRRIEGGSLAPGEADRLGQTLMELELKIKELQKQFGIEDLNMDLGPLGKLLDE